MIHIWVEKVIHWELCKRLKIDNFTKSYRRKPESVLENDMHKILCRFGRFQIDCLIQSKRQDLELINQKRNCYLVDLAVPVNHSVKIKESEKKDKYIGEPCKGNKKGVGWGR